MQRVEALMMFPGRMSVTSGVVKVDFLRKMETPAFAEEETE